MKNLKIKRLSRQNTLLSGLLTIVFFTAGAFSAFGFDDRGGHCDQNCRRDLARARRATAKYHNAERALADGFINTRQCVEVPGLGAMGIHFIRPDRIGNPGLSVTEPEVLLYLPDEEGEMRLVGLEYVVPAPLTSVVPELYGRRFGFNPMRNEYALHVWAWRHNPGGMFADFNPQLHCPQP